MIPDSAPTATLALDEWSSHTMSREPRTFLALVLMQFSHKKVHTNPLFVRRNFLLFETDHASPC